MSFRLVTVVRDADSQATHVNVYYYAKAIKVSDMIMCVLHVRTKHYKASKAQFHKEEKAFTEALTVRQQELNTCQIVDWDSLETTIKWHLTNAQLDRVKLKPTSDSVYPSGNRLSSSVAERLFSWLSPSASGERSPCQTDHHSL